MNVTFPKISSVNLEGERFDMPEDFKGKLNIIFLAFKREQQNLIDEWVPYMEGLVNKNQNLAYYELPTLQSSYSLMRRVIDGGMRAGIPDKNARERTITLYLNKKAFMKKLEIPDDNTIYILLLNREGKVIWRTVGSFAEGKLHDLEKSIEENIR